MSLDVGLQKDGEIDYRDIMGTDYRDIMGTPLTNKLNMAEVE